MRTNRKPTDRITEAQSIFKRHGGTMRTADAIKEGIRPKIIYKMRDTGLLEPLAWGLYRLTDTPELSNPDLVTVALKIPKGVICMISALAFHDMTTQIPHAIDVALVRGSETPRIKYPPVHIYWSVEYVFNCGIKEYIIDGKTIKVYSPEKALVDCFRHRNKLGLDTAIEALRLYRTSKPLKVDLIMEYARRCNVVGVIQPYLEGTL